MTFLHELLATLLMPLAGFGAVLLMASIAAACTLPKGERGLLTVVLRPETCTLQLWLLLLVHPFVARTALTPFDCVEVGERSLLRSNPAVACDDEHWKLLAAVAPPHCVPCCTSNRAPGVNATIACAIVPA